jgi:hypothetical protein
LLPSLEEKKFVGSPSIRHKVLELSGKIFEFDLNFGHQVWYRPISKTDHIHSMIINSTLQESFQSYS